MATGNAINANSTGLVRYNGTGTFDSVTTTNHNLLVGASSNGITSVAPSATSGVPVISQGASSDPTFGTAVVAGGGTGITSATAYAVICGGTTSTNPFQSIASVGNSGQVLTSNGAGALPTFQSISATNAFTQVAIQVFTTTGANTYTPTTGMKYCIVEVQGAGGGGGGMKINGVGQAAGGGGGAGAYARGVFSAATVGASQTVTIGTGGTAGSGATGATGGTGGTSSFGSLISCTGGVGGGGQNGDTTAGGKAGGAGGTSSGSGVSFSTTGAQGYPSLWNNSASGIFVTSGKGADSLLGKGGDYNLATAGSGNNAGGNGTNGGGGGGAQGSGNPGNANGGTGGNGICIVTEFISV